ncbi:unnamed protein product [Ectocarpus sp. CCAP 1310/34]|nr:unnamed protein product [Ectocarpus sp. CCAP 1310/34]
MWECARQQPELEDMARQELERCLRWRPSSSHPRTHLLRGPS